MLRWPRTHRQNSVEIVSKTSYWNKKLVYLQQLITKDQSARQIRAAINFTSIQSQSVPPWLLHHLIIRFMQLLFHTIDAKKNRMQILLLAYELRVDLQCANWLTSSLIIKVWGDGRLTGGEEKEKNMRMKSIIRARQTVRNRFFCLKISFAMQFLFSLKFAPFTPVQTSREM